MAQRVYLLSKECWRPADHLPHLAQIAMEELIGLGLFAVRSTLHAKLESGILLWDPVRGLRALPSTVYGHATNYIALNAGHWFIGRLGIWKAEWVLAKKSLRAFVGCCSLGPFVTAHRIMLFLLFPLFFAVFPLFFAQKIQDFLRCSSGWGFGGLGGGFGGWVSGRGGRGFRGVWGGGGGHNSVHVCVCAVVWRLPFFNNGCKRFFSLRQDVIFFVWRVWFCYCPCCLDRVRDLWFFWVGFEGFVFICVIYDI